MSKLRKWIKVDQNGWKACDVTEKHGKNKRFFHWKSVNRNYALKENTVSFEQKKRQLENSEGLKTFIRARGRGYYNKATNTKKQKHRFPSVNWHHWRDTITQQLTLVIKRRCAEVSSPPFTGWCEVWRSVPAVYRWRCTFGTMPVAI